MMALPSHWRRPLAVLVVAWLALAALYYPTGAAMVEIWNRSETFAHAWVVPPLSVWLVWRLRGELAVLVPQSSPMWLVALLPLGALWLLGDLASANAATQFALVGMGVVLVPAVLGSPIASRVMFPLGFLFFAVPFGDFLTPWLVERTADFTVLAVRATGIPVFREGTQFVIPTGSWSVVQACSGIRYLMASVMVGTLFAYLNYQSNRKRWAFVGVSVVTPLVANWLRAYMIVMLGHLSGNRLAVGVDHIIYGWVFFGIIMLAMFMMGARWADPDPVQRTTTVPEQGARVNGSRWAPLTWVAALVLLAVPALWRMHTAEVIDHAQAPVLQPAKLAGWQWQPVPLTGWEPHYVNPAARLHGHWVADADGATVGLYVGYYRHQTYGRQLVTSVNRLVNDEEFTPWAQTSSGVTNLGDQAWRTAELRGQALSQVSGDGSGALRLRALHVYWVGGRYFVSDWQAKLYGAWQQFLGHGDDAAAVVVYANKATVGPDDRLLRDFLRQHGAMLEQQLQATRAAAGRASQ
ncbi:exosortase A [Roseateles sp. BYS87W]|uniref:Exosortase A n=1 Tax=Pelomonas baiyunensis TaxID=3299026 RepID=A0ABW7GWW8_9BURK